MESHAAFIILSELKCLTISCIFDRVNSFNRAKGTLKSAKFSSVCGNIIL